MHVISCHNCSEPLQGGARFCPSCGSEVLQDSQNPELRILTVLFVDLVGSTAYAQKADLETYDGTISAFHDLVNRSIEAHQGTILQRFGDGVLACFGLMHDSEDSALSAIAAGLEIAKQAPEALDGQQVRVGIDSGQVMCRVGQTGTLYPQLTGLHVNRAARLQEEAPTGGVAMSGETRSFLSRLADIDIETENRKSLKGIDNKVDVITIKGFSFNARAAHRSRIIERDDIISELTDGPNKAVALVGPAGIGKSTLVHELIDRKGKDAIISLYARANLSQTALFPLMAAMRAEFDLETGAPIEALTKALSSFGVTLETEDTNIIAALLGLSGVAPIVMTPEQQKSRRLQVASQILKGLSLSRNAPIVFDDFHWVDDESSAVLQLVLQDETFPNRVVITTRPEDAALSFISQCDMMHVTLQPLTKSGATAVLDAYDDISEARKKEIISAAEGNPLFLTALAERARQLGGDADATPLPRTIEATFQAIITGLGDLKEIVQNAAVIGRDFQAEHLRLLMPDRDHLDQDLRALSEDGVFEPRRTGLAFYHVLLRDAAYAMIPGSRKRALHLTFAQELQSNFPDLCAELPELLADHLLAAHAHDQIPGACINAGISMLKSVNFGSAARYLEQARIDMETQAAPAAATRPEYLPILSLLASAQVQSLGFSHPSVLEAYTRLEAAIITNEGATDRQRMVALYGIFAHRVISGHVKASGELVEQMKVIAEKSDDELKVIYLVNETAHALYSGEFERAQMGCEALEAVYDTETHGQLFLELGADPLASVLSAAVHLHIHRGDKDRALATIDRALSHINAIGAVGQLPWIHIFSAQALRAGGHNELADDELAIGIRLADEQQAQFWSLTGRFWASAFKVLDGKSQALPEFEAYVGHLEAIGALLTAPYSQSVLALAHARNGDFQQALAHLSTAKETMHREGGYQWESDLKKISAEVSLLQTSTPPGLATQG